MTDAPEKAVQELSITLTVPCTLEDLRHFHNRAVVANKLPDSTPVSVSGNGKRIYVVADVEGAGMPAPVVR